MTKLIIPIKTLQSVLYFQFRQLWGLYDLQLPFNAFSRLMHSGTNIRRKHSFSNGLSTKKKTDKRSCFVGKRCLENNEKCDKVYETMLWQHIDIHPMQNSYTITYKTPHGFDDMVMTSDGAFLTGLSFIGSCQQETHGESCSQQVMLPVFQECCRWLDIYFSGQAPDFLPAYRLDGATAFRLEVSTLMLEIPFGKTVTYGDLAAEIAHRREMPKMSAQAVGGAVGWNPICIIIPCHRVVGAYGKMTGYGGGLHNKVALLAHEQRR